MATNRIILISLGLAVAEGYAYAKYRQLGATQAVAARAETEKRTHRAHTNRRK